MASTTDTNPYAGFYKSGFGTIIGRPMAYNSRCDPNQRVFQETLLRNNTIIRVTPGIYNFEKAKLAKITAETLMLIQNGERRAWGMDKAGKPGDDEGTIVVVERE